MERSVRWVEAGGQTERIKSALPLVRRFDARCQGRRRSTMPEGDQVLSQALPFLRTRLLLLSLRTLTIGITCLLFLLGEELGSKCRCNCYSLREERVVLAYRQLLSVSTRPTMMLSSDVTLRQGETPRSRSACGS